MRLPPLRKKKIYLYAEKHKTWLRLVGDDGLTVWYWAWGSETKPKRILQALTQTLGKEKWLEVYKQYNRALLHVSKMNEGAFKTPTWCITLYRPETLLETKQRSDREFKSINNHLWSLDWNNETNDAKN